MSYNVNKKLLIKITSIILLFLGLLIYSLFRDENLTINKLINEYILNTRVFNSAITSLKNVVPSFIIYSLPNGIWMLSLTMLILSIWNFKIGKNSATWIFMAFLIGINYEMLQKTSLVKGTFDSIDILFIILGTIASFILTIKFKTYERKAQNK